MTAIPAKPFQMVDCTVKIGADTYEAAVRTLRLVPTIVVTKWKGLTKTSRHTFVSDPEWVSNVTFAQDWASASSLSKYLHETPPGTEVELVFEPIAGGTPITVTIVTQPGDMGGDIDTVPEASVPFTCIGQPVLGTVGE